MREALIIGAGGQCRVVLSILFSLKDYDQYRILDIGKPEPGEFIMGISVTPLSSLLEQMPELNNTDVYLAIGSNKIRQEWWEKFNLMELSMPNLVSPHALVDTSCKLGMANIVCARAFIGPGANLGDNNLINTGAILEHEIRVGSHCHFAPSATLAGRCTVEDGCFIGAGATVMDNISISKNTVLGAGAVLLKSVTQSDSTLLGVPAKSRR